MGFGVPKVGNHSWFVSHTREKLKQEVKVPVLLDLELVVPLLDKFIKSIK
jgi:hypothetical protein